MKKKGKQGSREMFSPAFKRPPASLQLQAGEVHIWMGVQDRTESECSRFLRILSPDERMRAEQFRFEEHRLKFIARHGILRTILGKYLGVPAHTVLFHHGANGKPELAKAFRRSGVVFNISHSNGLALFAFARNHEIGVDIEHVRDIPEMEHIIERFFSPGERAFIHATPPLERRDAFFDCWTRKEAFIKATGTGLALPLSSFDVAPGQEERDAQGIDAEAQPFLSPWSVRTLRPAREHAGAVAVRSKNSNFHYFRWIPAAVS